MPVSHASTTSIVIVEDDPSILRLYETKLKLEGFAVRTASNARQGFDLLQAAPPDLLLLDIRMPGMQGDEMLAKVRRHDWGADIRVIILTNLSRDEAPSQLRFLAVDRYIVKAHYTPSQVVDIVREVLHIK